MKKLGISCNFSKVDVYGIIFLYDLDWMHNLNKLGVSSVKLKSLMVVKEWLPT